jgi:hypothetical protein
MKPFKEKFSFFIILSILGMVLIHFQPSHEEQKMKLIHVKSGFVVAEYKGEKTIIHDRILEKEMSIRGVMIPPALRSEYSGKGAVRLSDKEFQKAFKELYFATAFNPKNYHWEE